ncbi:MAG: dihydroorotase [Chitinophagales bacterium]|nr:dihydroorotase [Chitinophagales bacterium]
MKYCLQQVQIIDAQSKHHLKKRDILIDNGIITDIAPTIQSDKKTKTINFNHSYASVGFCDLYTQLGDPGNEHREDTESISKAASFGGFTTLCAIANNVPITQNKSQIEYIINQSKNTATTILPIGAITQNFDGKTPTEMIDMHKAGAIAFADIPNSINDEGVFLRALQYVKSFNGLIIDLPYIHNLTNDACINESALAVKMGLKGIPNIAEYMAVEKAIALLKYTDSKLHLTGISCKESVDLIAKAKKDGLNISCSVFVHHLIDNENAVANYQANYKVFPPLRSEKDQKALLKAVKDGTIDAIATQHTPLDTEAKATEFEYAQYGMIALETCFSLLNTYTDIPLERIIDALSYQPYKIINKEFSINNNSISNLSIFSIDEEWTVPTIFKSKSNNSPYIGKKLKGKVKAVFNKNQIFINE